MSHLPGLPTNAAQATKQDTGNTSLASIDTKLTTPALPTGAATAAKQDAAETTLSAIDTKLGSALPLPTGAATSAKQDTGNTSIASIDAKLPALSGGNVPVTIASSSLTDPAEVAQGTTAPAKVMVVGGKSNDGTAQYKELPLGAGARSVIVEGVASGTAVPVSVASVPLPTGAATETTLAAVNTKLGAALPLPSGASTSAKQDTAQTSLTSIDGKLTDVATQTTLALIKAKTDNLDATLSTRATSAKQDTGNTSLSSIDGKLTDVATQTTLAAVNTNLGTDGATPPAITGTGIRGWLRGIYEKLAASLTVVVAAGSALIGKVGIDQSTPGTTNKVSIGTDGTVGITGTVPLPTGASTEATLALIKAKTDNIDVALSTRTKPADTQVVAGNITNNNAAPGSNNVGAMPGVATAIPQAYVDGNEVFASLDLQGATRITGASIPVFVQKTDHNQSTGSVASLTKAYSNPVAKGNTLVVTFGVGNNTTPTISDTINTWKLALVKTSAGHVIGIYYCIAASAATPSVVLSNGGATASMAMHLYEVAGAHNVVEAVLDKTSSGGATSAAPNSGTVSPLLANEVVIGCIGIGTAAQTVTVTAGSLPSPVWTNDSGQLNPTTPAGLFSFVSASTIVYNPSQAVALAGTVTSEPWTAIIALFRPVTIPVTGTVAAIGSIPSGTAIAQASNPVPIAVKNTTNSTLDLLCGLNTASGVAALVTLGGSAAFTEITTSNVNAQAAGGGGISNPTVVMTGAASAITGAATTLLVPRIANIFKSVSVAASSAGDNALWTPTAGKKFRLMRFQITGSNLAATAATVVTLLFRDSSTGMAAAYDVLLPAVAGVQAGSTQISAWVDLSNGILSASANNVLNLNVSSAPSGATGAYRVNLIGIEE